MEHSDRPALPAYLKGLISAADIRAEFRVGRQAQWDSTLEEMTYIPVAYTNASIDYQLAYQQGHGDEWWDVSLIVFWDNKPSVIWPRSFRRNHLDLDLRSSSIAVGPIRPALFTIEVEFELSGSSFH